MIDHATGMKPSERYRVENLERAHQFPGFFQDGKYYLGPELLTAVGWLEGTKFIYDSLDAEGEPVFPDRVAGSIEGLKLVLIDGTSLALSRIEASATLSPATDDIEQHPQPAGPARPAPITGPLRGKVVVITGASSGIGRAAAHAFACKGARLVLAARDEQALFDVLDECTDCGTDAVAITTDVTSNEQVQALAAQAAEFGQGRIDIWVNNAGVGAVGNFEETPLDAHEQVIQTDLIGYLRGAYVALPYFKAQRSGMLINTLSLGSWVAQPYAAAYSASKFGLRGLTEALRGELTEFPDIHVCDIYPAVMDTPGFRDGGNYTGHALTPPGPIYDPELVAKAMVACAISPRARTTVGATARLAHLASFLIPGLPLVSGWLTRWGLNRSASAEISSGNLFEPPSGRRSVDGGWRTPKSKTPLLVSAAVLGIIAGFVITRSQRRPR
ncbi:SDR family oxidoreductase [Pseudomonas sp. P1B16]|uniref:SDR family oxidoreductase n=1 Tax=Pseudomonas TaxID=286 RepID=UPI000BA4DB69|nr:MULTISPECIES: SDR family oxidoreductase [unclassified Pseudomonas]WPM28477.1 SDR family oxidoreductase [Pseudomonas sp. P1B16]